MWINAQGGLNVGDGVVVEVQRIRLRLAEQDGSMGDGRARGAQKGVTCGTNASDPKELMRKRAW